MFIPESTGARSLDLGLKVGGQVLRREWEEREIEKKIVHFAYENAQRSLSHEGMGRTAHTPWVPLYPE